MPSIKISEFSTFADLDSPELNDILPNAGDNGKTLIINYEYLLKLDPSEIPGT